MAFRLPTTKWQIFRRPVGVHLECSSDICGAAPRLHNFVIDNEGRSFSKDLWSTSDFKVQLMTNNQPGVSKHNKGHLNTLPTLVSRGKTQVHSGVEWDWLAIQNVLFTHHEFCFIIKPMDCGLGAPALTFCCVHLYLCMRQLHCENFCWCSQHACQDCSNCRNTVEGAQRRHKKSLCRNCCGKCTGELQNIFVTNLYHLWITQFWNNSLGEMVSHQLECPIDNLIRNQELYKQSQTDIMTSFTLTTWHHVLQVTTSTCEHCNECDQQHLKGTQCRHANLHPDGSTNGNATSEKQKTS